tara:strand:- start:1965 stop:2489 length:525 start_codon:yes stop_codon:yes gene_type:complete
MAFEISEFAAQAGTDYARANLFEVEIGDLVGAKLLVKTASLPNAMVNAIEIPYMNRKWKVPGDRVFNDWTVTVINDESYVLRKALITWQGNLTAFSDMRSAVKIAGSHQELTVRPYSRDGNAVTGADWKMFGWPSDIGTIDLSWDNADTIQEYSVTFSISWDNGGNSAKSITLA